MKPQPNFTLEIEVPGDEYPELEFVVDATVEPYVPARLSGPPDNCSPAEGGEVEILSIKLGGHVVSERCFIENFGMKAFEEMVEEMASEAGTYSNGPDDYYDRDDFAGFQD